MWSREFHEILLFRFRLSRYQQFKDFQKRILVATNLFGRGMDIERVNIVFNYDMPEDSDTYLHRVSRHASFFSAISDHVASFQSDLFCCLFFTEQFLAKVARPCNKLACV